MHASPSPRERLAYIEQNKGWFYFWGCLSFALVTLGAFLFLRLAPLALVPYAVFIGITTLYMALSYGVGLFAPGWSYKKHEGGTWLYETSKHTPFPTVDIYLPSCGEPAQLLENTYHYVSKLNYPKERLRVYVLDDAGFGLVKHLAATHGFEYISRHGNYLKKAGNLRHAFTRTEGEYILILDADFCPDPNILWEMLVYMEDPRVAIVQSPQYFSVERHMSWIEKGAGFVQELFYRMIQVNRDAYDAAVCVGTNALYRRTALEPMGGTAPIEYSEDMHTGFYLTHDGWKVRYIPLVLAKGICPDTLPKFFVQQYRWCAGSFNLFLTKEFWRSRLTLTQKAAYLTGMGYYISTGLSIFFGPVPSIVVLWFFPEHIHWWNWVFILPSFFFGTYFMATWSRHRWGLYAPMSRYVSYWAHLFAIIDRARGKLIPWTPTGGSTAPSDRYKQFRFWAWGVLIASIILTLGGLASASGVVEWQHFLPLIFFSTFNYGLQFAVLRSTA